MTKQETGSGATHVGASPGPWTECGNGRCSCRIVWSAVADAPVATAFTPKRAVACVHGEWGDGPDMIYGEVSAEIVAANARLIAAAPALLEALEDIRAAVGRMVDRIALSPDNNTQVDLWMSKLNAADAAISLASGPRS